MENNITEKYIDGIYILAGSQFPDSVLLQAKKCLLDYLGATLAGAKMLQDKGKSLLSHSNAGSQTTTVIGFNHKSDIYTAILINGLSSHIAELDDGERFGMIHPGAPTISTLLPFCEKENLDGKALLKGIIVGYEAGIRLARSVQPSLKDKGYHATGVCGTAASALGIASMLKFSKEEMKNALSAALTGASGMLKVLEDESQLKPYNAGKAAVSGYLASILARSGFKGPEDVLSGERGFLSLVSEKNDVNELFRTSADKFSINNRYVKPYAACRHCHPPIEAVLKLRENYKIQYQDIKEITVQTYRWAVKLHDHTDITGVTSAKMSTPYSVAVALVTGKAGLDEFSNEAIKDERILSLTKKVSVKNDDQLSALVPHKRAAIVEIITYDGKVFTERVDLPKGEPENPLTDEELKKKFISLAQYGGKTDSEIEEIIDCVFNIENKLDRLITLL